jgi:putative endonuclease
MDCAFLVHMPDISSMDPHLHGGRGEENVAFYVYLLASQKNGTLYCGHTDDIARRAWQHREGHGAAFTRRNRVTRLVWYEVHDTREGAKTREYQIKKWKRAWKIRLIEETNSDWKDLFFTLNQ